MTQTQTPRTTQDTSRTSQSDRATQQGNAQGGDKAADKGSKGGAAQAGQLLNQWVCLRSDASIAIYSLGANGEKTPSDDIALDRATQIYVNGVDTANNMVTFSRIRSHVAPPVSRQGAINVSELGQIARRHSASELDSSVSWAQLYPVEQWLLVNWLRWSQESWDSGKNKPDTESKPFAALGAEEQAAARALGYTAGTWDKTGKQELSGADQQKVAEKLKNVGPVDDAGALVSVAGGLIDSLLNPGEKLKLTIAWNPNIPAFPKIKLHFQQEFELERDTGKSTKLKAKVSSSFGVIGELKAKWASAFAKLAATLFMEVQGDNGVEVVRLMLLAMAKRIANVPSFGLGQKISDWFLGKKGDGGLLDTTLKGMDQQDYAKVGGDIKATAGFKLGTDEKPGEQGSAHIGYESVDTFTKGKDGQLARSNAQNLMLGFTFGVGDWMVEVKGKVGTEDGGKVNSELEISLARMVDTAKWTKTDAIIKAMAIIVGKIRSSLRAKGKADAAGLSDAIHMPAISLGVSQLTAKSSKHLEEQLMSRIRSSGLMFGQKFTVKIVNGVTDLTLESISSAAYSLDAQSGVKKGSGADPNAFLYAGIEKGKILAAGVIQNGKFSLK